MEATDAVWIQDHAQSAANSHRQYIRLREVNGVAGIDGSMAEAPCCAPCVCA